MKHLKPSRQTYAYVERELGVEPSQLCLIACHTWDTLGAVAAGWQAALVKRAGNDVLQAGPQPQIVGDDLDDVADQLIARHKAPELTVTGPSASSSHALAASFDGRGRRKRSFRSICHNADDDRPGQALRRATRAAPSPARRPNTTPATRPVPLP
ncbi:MAG TPA: HAD hydrolase-like protein [Reyranella sp.]|nr:HAD hydrolase-like protein [Reyranella sp.]